MKNYKYILFVVILMFITQGCRDKDCYQKVHHDGLKKIDFARKMTDWYGVDNVDHFITGFGNDNGLIWNSVAYASGRYVLTIQISVEVDYKKCTIVKLGNDLKVYLDEVDSLRISDTNRITGAKFKDNGLPSEYNASKWIELESANGDLNAFSTRDKKIELHSPVARFDEYREIWGKDRIKIN